MAKPQDAKASNRSPEDNQPAALLPDAVLSQVRGALQLLYNGFNYHTMIDTVLATYCAGNATSDCMTASRILERLEHREAVLACTAKNSKGKSAS